MNNKIISFINKIFRNDEIAKTIARISETELENIDIKINDIKSNIFLDSAIWGLDIFEKELDLEYVENKTLSERKAIISAKWRGAGKLTLELIKDTVKAYDINVKVIFNGMIIFDFSDKIGKPKYFKELEKTIQSIKPAHLGVDYIFKYRNWGELLPYNWGELLQYTWVNVFESEFK